MTERCRCFLLFEAGIPPVTNHYAIDNMVLCRSRIAARKSAEDCEFSAIQLFAGPIDFRQTMMGIDHRSRIAGEMFPAPGHAASTQSVVKRRRVPEYLLDCLPVTSTTQRIAVVV